MHYINQMKHNFVISFLFFPLPWEKVPREEPKCRCNPTSTAVGDRHVGTTVYIKMTSGFSTCSLNVLRSLPSQHLLSPPYYLQHFHQLFKSVAHGQTWSLLFCPSEHLSCTTSLDNQEIKGQNSSFFTSGFGKVWRDIYASVSAPVRQNAEDGISFETHLFTKPKF